MGGANADHDRLRRRQWSTAVTLSHTHGKQTHTHTHTHHSPTGAHSAHDECLWLRVGCANSRGRRGG